MFLMRRRERSRLVQRYKNTHYLKMDFFRAFVNKTFFLTVFGITLFLLLMERTQLHFRTDVVYIYDMLKMQRSYLLLFVFCVIPYGGCFCEDAEKRFFYPELIRGNCKNYVWSKIISSFTSGFLVGFFGVLLFFWIESVKYPVFLSGNYNSFFLEKGMGWLFLVEALVRESLLRGTLCAVTAAFSLCLRNKMFTMTFPMMFYYFFVNYISNWFSFPSYMNLYAVYSIFYEVWGNEWLDFFYAFFFSAVSLVFTGIWAEILMKREVRRR